MGGKKKNSKIDTIGDAYIMVAWLSEGLDPYEPRVKHATSTKACTSARIL
jgi:hypothetical protein